jgi:hypothetical protein
VNRHESRGAPFDPRLGSALIAADRSDLSARPGFLASAYYQTALSSKHASKARGIAHPAPPFGPSRGWEHWMGMFAYKLAQEDGTPADQPVLHTAVPTWDVGGHDCVDAR